MTKRLCISVSDDDAFFLDSMHLSPSGLLKQRILQIKEDSTNYKNMLNERENAIVKLNEHIQKLNTEIENLKNGTVQQETASK